MAKLEMNIVEEEYEALLKTASDKVIYKKDGDAIYVDSGVAMTVNIIKYCGIVFRYHKKSGEYVSQSLIKRNNAFSYFTLKEKIGI